jgi:hypothetical protein
MLLVAQVVKKLHLFIVPEGPLDHSQEHTTGHSGWGKGEVVPVLN